MCFDAQTLFRNFNPIGLAAIQLLRSRAISRIRYGNSVGPSVRQDLVPI